MAKRGRPSKFSQELADKICQRLALGVSLRTICREDGMPERETIFRWLAGNCPNFYDQYARARKAGVEALGEELIDISDDGTNDWMEAYGSDSPGWRVNGEHIQRSRLRIDTRKWVMSKLAPKKYGERLEVAGDPESPIVAPANEIEVARRVAFLLNRAAKKQEA